MCWYNTFREEMLLAVLATAGLSRDWENVVLFTIRNEIDDTLKGIPAKPYRKPRGGGMFITREKRAGEIPEVERVRA